MISLCTPTRFEAWLEKSGASKRFVDEKRYWLKTNGDQHGCNTALAHNGGLAGQWHEARTKSNAKAFANWTVGWLVSVDAALSIYTTLKSAILFSFFVFFWYFLIVTLLNFDWLRLACVRLLMVAHPRRVQAEDRLANIFKSLLEIGGAQFVARGVRGPRPIGYCPEPVGSPHPRECAHSDGRACPIRFMHRLMAIQLGEAEDKHGWMRVVEC